MRNVITLFNSEDYSAEEYQRCCDEGLLGSWRDDLNSYLKWSKKIKDELTEELLDILKSADKQYVGVIIQKSITNDGLSIDTASQDARMMPLADWVEEFIKNNSDKQICVVTQNDKTISFKSGDFHNSESNFIACMSDKGQQEYKQNGQIDIEDSTNFVSIPPHLFF